MNAQAWIRTLKLRPHPEGGFFRETYRAGETIPAKALPRRFPGPRSLSTAIYFLLRRGQVSHLHRIRSDELWHHYAGGTLIIHCLLPDGRHTVLKLGKHPDRGEQPQVMVPAGVWFGAIPAPRTSFALVGCTVAPGFDFADFEMGNTDTLKQDFPKHQAVIDLLCPKTVTKQASPEKSTVRATARH